jgi:hypothetical protein
MTQTWKIKGQVYTHAQLMELKKQGLDPRKDDIVMKFITNPQPEANTPKIETNEATKALEGMDVEKVEVLKNQDGEVITEKEEVPTAQENGVVETEEEEFARLTKEKAWVNKSKKERYSELKAKFTK